MCIEEYLVTRQQLQAAVGDRRSVSAADHDDDRLSGNVQIPERVAHPGMMCLKDDLLSLDADVILIDACHQHKIVTGEEHHIAPGNNDVPSPLDGVRVPTAEEVEPAEQLLHVRDYPDAPKGSTAK